MSRMLRETDTWMGAIPESWATPPLYATYDVQLGKMLNPDAVQGDHLAPYLRNVDVQWDRINTDGLPEMNFPPEFVARYRLRKGDLLVCEGGEVGRTAIWNDELPECYYQKALHRLRPRTGGQNRRFMYYALFAAAQNGAFEEGGSKSTILHLPAEKLRRHRFPLPSTDEQRAIADFLDRKTAAIDALITKKERLIELLEEKRQALITQAVTKGLDPSVPMKDSGIEWLGPIPAHWGIAQLGWNLKFISYGFTNPMPSTDEGPYMVTANDIGDGEVLYDTARRTDVNECVKLTRKCRPQRGDILLTKDGTLGRVAVADGREMCVNQSVAVLTVNGRYGNTSFTQYALRCRTYQDRMLFEAGGTTIKHIYISRLAKMPIAFPPVEEQVVICQRVASLHGRFGPLVDRVHQTVRALREYRQALITAAVTGKIDLTAAADRKLPFEAGIG